MPHDRDQRKSPSPRARRGADHDDDRDTDHARAASRHERLRGHVSQVLVGNERQPDEVDIDLGSDDGVEVGDRGVVRADSGELGILVEEVGATTSKVRVYGRSRPSELGLEAAPVELGTPRRDQAFHGQASIMRKSVSGGEVQLTLSRNQDIQVGQRGVAKEPDGRVLAEVTVVRVGADGPCAVPVDAMDAGLTRLQHATVVEFGAR